MIEEIVWEFENWFSNLCVNLTLSRFLTQESGFMYLDEPGEGILWSDRWIESQNLQNLNFRGARSDEISRKV